MTRPIDADAVYEWYLEAFKGLIKPNEIRFSMNDIRDNLQNIPTIDAKPVRHGKWANDAVGVLRCSECNAQAPWRFIGRGYNEVDYRWKSDYCPNCGADMRGEVNDGQTDN